MLTTAMVVNYGLDKVRFPAPLPVGERVHMRVALDTVDPIPGGAALSLTLTFERAAGGKPVCVATAIYRVYE
jgi:acyl dehydratase